MWAWLTATWRATKGGAGHEPEFDEGLVVEPLRLPDRVQFTYQRSDGVQRRRTVVVQSIERDRMLFTGWCETTNAGKTFNIRGVRGTVTRMETGEILPALPWYRALGKKRLPG